MQQSSEDCLVPGPTAWLGCGTGTGQSIMGTDEKMRESTLLGNFCHTRISDSHVLWIPLLERS